LPSASSHAKGRKEFYPTDCSKFLYCTKESPTIEMFDCPEPFLFDPEHLKWNLPQFVPRSSEVVRIDANNPAIVMLLTAAV
jgi:hypothetical protein